MGNIEHQHVAADGRYSYWLPIRALYSMLRGKPRHLSRNGIGQGGWNIGFRTSPNSYCLLTPSASTPVARYGVSCAPKLDFQRAHRFFSVL